MQELAAVSVNLRAQSPYMEVPSLPMAASGHRHMPKAAQVLEEEEEEAMAALLPLLAVWLRLTAQVMAICVRRVLEAERGCRPMLAVAPEAPSSLAEVQFSPTVQTALPLEEEAITEDED